MTSDQEYFRYLSKRSRLGYLYRKFWLYPKISRSISGRVLDVGCGIGDFLHYYNGAVGVDVNPATVAYCQSRGLNAEYMAVDTIPFCKGSFDCVILDNVLEHLSEPKALLSEIHRVVVPGGILVVGVPGKRGFAADVDHKVFYDKELLTATLTRAGFQLRHHFYTPMKSDWMNVHATQYCLYGVFESV